MKISVIAVCYNEEENIGDCLQSLLAMDYPEEDFEILVVDNDSNDRTQDIVSRFRKEDPRVRLFVNPVRSIAASRNRGLEKATFPFVAFTDADCRVPPQWLSTMAEGFQRIKAQCPQLVAVGGTNIAPPFHTRFYDAVNIMLKTFLGNRGSTQGREFSQDTFVDHIPTLNILYEKKTLQDFGGFDEAFRFACEDPELNHRLVKANYKIAYLNGLHVVHRFRPGFGPWIRRCFSYGKGRTQILLKHPDHLSLVLLVPQAIALLWLTAPMTFLNAPLLWNPVALYASFLFLYAAGLCTIKGKWHLSGHVFLLYLVTHFSFGLGQLWGLGLNGNRTAAGLNTQP